MKAIAYSHSVKNNRFLRAATGGSNRINSQMSSSVAIKEVGKNLPLLSRIKAGVASLFRRPLWSKETFTTRDGTKYRVNINSLAKTLNRSTSKIRQANTEQKIKNLLFHHEIKDQIFISKKIQQLVKKAGLKHTYGNITDIKDKYGLIKTDQMNINTRNTGSAKTTQKVNFIASGSFKNVYATPDGKALAILKTASLKAISEMIKENQIAMQFRGNKHLAAPARKIIYLRDGNTVKIGFLFPKYDGDALEMADRAKNFTWIAKGAAKGVRDMHKKGIAHRDIKLANLFLEKKKKNVRVGDFGFAVKANSSPQVAGTPDYMAPELLDYPYSDLKKADIYSLGMTFYACREDELLGYSTALPYEGAKKGSIEELINEMLAYDPTKRPTAAQVVERLENIYPKS